MRKLLLVVTAGLMMLGMTGAQAAEGTRSIMFPSVFEPPGPASLLVPGSVFTLKPQGCLFTNGMPDPAGTPQNCEKETVTKVHRCLWLAEKDGLVDPNTSQNGSTGRFGYTFAISSGQRGDSFTLKDVTAGLSALPELPTGGKLDFDIVFYKELGSCQTVNSTVDPVLGLTPTEPAAGGNFMHIGNEKGNVPITATYAIVALTSPVPNSGDGSAPVKPTFNFNTF